MVDDTEIGELESIKFFGIHFDQGLTWNHHIDNKCKKILSANIYTRSLA